MTGRAGHLEAVERVKDWTRARFGLGEGDLVMVSEAAGALPGYPPRETHVAFWTEDRRRRHFTVFKTVEEIAPEDVPPAWMKDALALSDGMSCACC